MVNRGKEIWTSRNKTDEILTVYLSGRAGFAYILGGYMNLAVWKFWRSELLVKLMTRNGKVCGQDHKVKGSVITTEFKVSINEGVLGSKDY